MTDVVVCVMVYPGDTTGKTAEETRRAYMRGDIVSVYPLAQLELPVNTTIRADGSGPGRLRYIRVSDCPGTVASIKGALTERVDHDNDSTTPGRSWWKGDALIMLTSWPDKYAQLRDDGYTDLTWAEVKTIVKNFSGEFITDADVS